MRKFAIKITKGNDIEIVSTHNIQEEALENGDKVNSQLPSNAGVVSCILAEFDENNNMVGAKYQLYKTWL